MLCAQRPSGFNDQQIFDLKSSVVLEGNVVFDSFLDVSEYFFKWMR